MPVANRAGWGDRALEPSRGKRIGVPCERQEHDAACGANPARFRPHLTAVCGHHPARCPASISAGVVRHATRWSLTQPVRRRRLARKATAGGFLGRPACLLPARVGQPEAVAKALALRHWGVPCAAWVSVCGRAALSWSRVAMAVGRPAIVGSPVTPPAPRPAHVLADEQHPGALRHEGSGATTGGGRGRRVGPGGAGPCAHLQPHAGVPRRRGRPAERLEAPLPDERPSPGCPSRGPQERRALGACSRAAPARPGPGVAGLSRLDPGVPGAPRPSHALDRLRHPQDRRLDARRSRPGTPEAARLALRAIALPGHVPPSGARTRRADPTRRSPCHDRKACASHPHGLHNLLIASSMGGRKL